MRNALGPMGSSLLWFALLVGCSSDAKLNVNNAIPAAVILSHASGDGVREGEVLTLVGSVTDAYHAAEDLTATWSAEGVTACEGTAVPWAPAGHMPAWRCAAGSRALRGRARRLRRRAERAPAPGS